MHIYIRLHAAAVASVLYSTAVHFVAYQVVVGTNVAIGELRGLCETGDAGQQGVPKGQRMSFPIIIFDEAGQVGWGQSLASLQCMLDT